MKDKNDNSFYLQTSGLYALNHSLSHPFFKCLCDCWTFTKACGNLSSINHHQISCNDSSDGSQDKKHDRQHYEEWALWFQLKLEVVRLVKSPRDRKKIKERQKETLLWCSGSSGSHQKQQREETINYEYITDENRLLERAEDGRRTGCQSFITHKI